MNKEKVYKRLFVGFLFFAVLFAIHFFGLTRYFSLQELKNKQYVLLTFVQTSYIPAVLAYIGAYIVAVTFSLPAAALLTVAGGFLFGTLLGAVYANVGATVGATLAFLLVRYVFGSYMQERYAKQLVRFNDAMLQQGTFYLLSIHLVAVVPFFLINLLAGLTRVSLWTFVWTTSVGIFPSSLVYAFAGRQLHNIRALSDIFTFKIFLAFVLIALLALLPTLLRVIRNAMQTRDKG